MSVRRLPWSAIRIETNPMNCEPNASPSAIKPPSSAHPHDFATNNIFILKLCLIATAGVNAALFHVGVYRSVSQWNTGTAAPAIAKVQAVLSMALWVTAVLCGRLLAYT